uniref:glycerophosphodiester phosphodiesterase n=1 Tax=Euplotes harpa TaxID=151035 RepID=A0A7S3J4L1_9SPIT|mmetsp:Transcript_16471/g.19039  ORF Transcript_16471/g.19039 Transcript_16471/m.19039 type:complete len:364 (+) Transcript_16471:19-1110(+)
MKQITLVIALLLFVWSTNALPINCPYFSNSDRPLILAHRGACGELPEHSAAAYTAAYYDGTDFNEPDLQVTKDGKLFIMHNPCMKNTTNIDSIPAFHDRRTNVTFVGKQANFECTDDYLVNDFTFQELIDAGVKLRNRYDTRNPFFNDMFPPMHLEQAIELMLDLNMKSPREDRQFRTGLYIETKQVEFYKTYRNVDIAKILFETLQKYNLDTIDKAQNKLPIILESFEEDSLLYFKQVTDLPLIQLLSYDYHYDLDSISTFAHGVGPSYRYMFSYKDEPFNLDKPSKFIQECHNKDLNVHPWIFQDDFLHYTKNSVDELNVYLTKGVDGVFTEFPQTSLQSIEHLTKIETRRSHNLIEKMLA